MKVKACEIVTKTDYLPITRIEKVLSTRDCIRKYAYIIHDKDIFEDNTPKDSHYHIVLQFTNAYDIKNIAQWFGIQEQFVGKIKGRFKDALLYLTHKNRTDKYQYDNESVISNFNFLEEINKTDNENRKNEIINLIAEGKIKEYNKHNFITPIEFSNYKNIINNAFEYRAETIKGAYRNMDCIYITGESGTGKSTYAKLIAEQNNYNIFISSSSNDVLDGYRGEECILLDDLRPSSLGMSDLLKMLDNNTSSTVKSRYRNKVLECKLIIITSILNINDFYSNVFEKEKEPIIQLERRCKTHITMHTKTIDIKTYNLNLKSYGHTITIKNPVYDMYNNIIISKDDELNYLNSLLGDFEIIEDNNNFEQLSINPFTNK